MIRCRICNRLFDNLTPHIKAHGFTTNKYKEKFGVKFIQSKERRQKQNNRFKGHNWGKCRKCCKVHIHPNLGMKFPEDKYPNFGTRGKHLKITGQALKNIQEANRNPKKIRKYKQTMKKRYGYVSPTTGKHWKLTGEALKNHQKANRKRIGKSYEEMMGSKEKANKRKITISKANIGREKTEQAIKKSQEAMLKNWQNPEFRKKHLEYSRKAQYPNLKYKNINFRSPGEITWYKWFETLSVSFGYEVLYTDFTFFKNGKPVLSMEHHPDSRYYKATPENTKKYYKERRKLLDDNGHKDIQLIVTTNIDEESKNDIRKLLGLKEENL